MQKVKLTIAYLGTFFHGWQAQDGVKTVQGELNLALEKLYGEPIHTLGSGRTDEGVHAVGQVAHFLAPKIIEPRKILNALNSFLDKDISVVKVENVSKNFSALASAKSKTYEYRGYISDIRDPLLEGREVRLKPTLKYDLMREAAALFVGEHDFAAFRCVGSSAKTTTRIVYKCEIKTRGKAFCLTISANGFLYKMARQIMGALIKVGDGKFTLADIADLLQNKKKWTHTVAPACGLYLIKVKY